MENLPYNGDPAFKAKVVKEAEWHEVHDRYHHRWYRKTGAYGQRFRGCSLGCTVNSLDRVQHGYCAYFISAHGRSCH